MKWGVLGSLILVGSVVVYGILAYDLENKKINWSVFISAMILFPKYFLVLCQMVLVSFRE